MDPRNKIIDPLLTQLAIGYSAQDFIAPVLFPIFQVAQQGGIYYKFDRSHLQLVDTARAQGSRTNEIPALRWTKDSFYAEDHALKQLVADEDVKQAAGAYDPRAQATRNVTEHVFIGHEVEAAGIVFNTSIVTQFATLSGTSKWSNAAGDPVANIQAASTAIEAATGLRPNTVAMGRAAFDALMSSATVVEKIKYSALGTPTDDIIKRLFKIDNIVVGKSIYNTSAPGLTPVMSDIWGDSVIVAYVAPTPEMKTLTFGWTFQYENHVVDTWYVRDEKGEWIRDSWYYQQKVVAPQCAYVFYDAV